MKKIITLFLFFISIILVTSCEITSNGYDKPEVEVNGSTIKWEEVDGAIKYIVYVDGVEHKTTTSVYHDLSTLEDGTYEIVVKAIFEDETKSTQSDIVTVVIKSTQIEITLDDPVISLSDNKLTWKKVEKAQKYSIYIDDKLIATTYSLSYVLPNLETGKHVVYIKAIYSDNSLELTSTSNKIEFEVEELGERIFNIFMINDTHGAFTNSNFPGLEKVNTLIKSLEEQNGEYIKVLNGDGLQGSYVSSTQYGRPIIDALNVMEFDAFVIGNHEFDWGLDKIHQYKDGDLSNGEANFPFLGANIIDKRTNERVSWIDPYTIVENNGVRVGIIGLIGYNQESSILAPMVKDYDFVYPLEIVESLSKELRTEKDCDAVIVSLHDFDESLQDKILDLPVTSRVDAILCAHMHSNEFYVGQNTAGVNVPVVENRDKNQTATSLIINLDASTSNNYTFKRLYPADYKDDAEVLEVVKKYQHVLDEANKVVGYTNGYLSKNTIGTYAANAMRDKFNADFGIINSGGVRATINSGDITVSEIFEALPFNNEVIIVELYGSNILDVCDDTYFIYSDGFYLSSIIPSKVYKVAIIDYVYYSNYNAALRNDSAVDTDVVLRDIAIEYIDNLY